MFTNNSITEDYDEFVEDELSYFDQEFNDEFSEEAADIADAVFDVLQSIADEKEDIDLDEVFTSKSNASYHFRKHCLGNTTSRRSVKDTVYYDFSSLSDYENREASINSIASSIKQGDKFFINDLMDTSKLLNALRLLFEGNKTIVFGLACGFTDTRGGNVKYCLHSWATDATTNYSQNTVDFLVLAPDGKTISMYPLDASYVENKLNNSIRRVRGFSNFNLKINH